MRAMDLNLASRPFKNNTLLWVGYVLAFVALAAFTSWNIYAWREHVGKLAELQDTVQSIESRMSDLDRREELAEAGIKEHDLEALDIQSAKANEVIAWKAFSWTQLFNRMEVIQPYDVRMTSIRPLFRAGARRGRGGPMEGSGRKSIAVAVEGVAKDFDAFWEMQNVLLADDHFGQVDPERLNRSEKREIIFQLSFQYYPGAADEADEDVEKPAASDVAEAIVEQEPAQEPQQEAEPEEEQAAAAGEPEEPEEEEPEQAQPEEAQPEEAQPEEAQPEEARPAEAAAAAAAEERPKRRTPGEAFMKAKRKSKGKRR
jgi:hypothetical protein